MKTMIWTQIVDFLCAHAAIMDMITKMYTLFTDSMYDFTNHNILKSLSHRYRKKDEFICHNCHISLTNDPPLIPHNCIYNELHDHNLLASCIMCKKQLYHHSMLQFNLSSYNKQSMLVKEILLCSEYKEDCSQLICKTCKQKNC